MAGGDQFEGRPVEALIQLVHQKHIEGSVRTCVLKSQGINQRIPEKGIIGVVFKVGRYEFVVGVVGAIDLSII